MYARYKENIVWNYLSVKAGQTRKDFTINFKTFNVCVVEAIGESQAGEIYNLTHYLKKKVTLKVIDLGGTQKRKHNERPFGATYNGSEREDKHLE